MAGRGGVQRSTTEKTYIDGPRARSLGLAGSTADPRIMRLSANGIWEIAQEPLHADIDTKKLCGIGPGLTFAKHILDGLQEHQKNSSVSSGSKISLGLVPCAVGGSYMSEWQPGQPYYQALVKRAKIAMSADSPAQLAGMLWLQGESDAMARDIEGINSETSSHVRKDKEDKYRQGLLQFLRQLRSDLEYPALPILVIEVQKAAMSDGEQTVFVSAQRHLDAQCSVTLADDNLHLTTDANLALGQLVAASYLKAFSSTIYSS